MRKLIVNADGFGLSRGVNKGVVRAYRMGIVTSASALVNSPHWDHAANLARRFSNLGVGLHFNLTTGRPITEPDLVPSLVDEEGNFSEETEALAQANVTDICRELFNQYQRLCNYRIKPTHVDSHHNIDALDGVLEVVLDFAARHSLPVRLVPQAKGHYRKYGVKTTAALIDGFQHRGANKLNFERLIRQCRASTAELRCHPGTVDAELEKLSAYTWQRERELAVVRAYGKEDFAHKYGFELINFKGLENMAQKALIPAENRL